MLLDFWRNNLGNTTMLFAIAAVPIFGAAGVAVDSFHSNEVRSNLDAAIDGAVLAGAAAKSNSVKIAQLYFDNNFKMPKVTSVKSAFAMRSDSIITGTATATFSPSFSRILGYDTMNVSSDAAAEFGGDTSEPSGSACIIALSPTATQSLLANSGTDVNAASCEIHVASMSNPAAIFNARTTLKSKKICIAGSSIIDNGGTHPNTETNCDASGDPFAGLVPVPTNTACNYNNATYTGNVTLNPGVYCGWHNFNSGSNVNLNPGVYVIKSGGWNVNGGDWQGDGVTFYFADTSNIQFNSAVSADLKAPKAGPYANFLFTEKSNLAKSPFVFDDNKGFDMTGIIYLPSRNVIFNSGAKLNTQKITAVMNTVIFNEVKWNLVQFDKGQPGTITEKLVRLIE